MSCYANIITFGPLGILLRFYSCWARILRNLRNFISAIPTPSWRSNAWTSHSGPPPGMQFVGHELAVAAYIFANGLQLSEILVENEHCTGNWEALWTLRPGEEVVDDVINLVVAMFSSNMAEKQRWWLPTTFAQIAMSPGHHCKSTLDYIVAKYMGFVDNLLKIYVPLHMGRHCYLMIVDMWDQNLIYLDSLKSTVERQARIDQILEVVSSHY
ncbi:ubiquitin-like-specific protease 1A [Arachis ipaensis]|uniref:ubiquitin-like-specific protease 1A n=1 Tax=Arachis ipaensis TaxID=130454 RepID=UPI000A2B0E08|nr:ubiquitin-like-specific protease 1A [Arachis ipaensis]XP_025632334.1 ubiquitin-like-specific protease 1A [Arachis hypogaea]